MKCFKKTAPLFLAVVFTFASVPAFSQFKFTSTTIPECDQYLQAYGVAIYKTALKMFPNMPDKTSTELAGSINDDLKEKSKEIRDKIEFGEALGVPIVQQLKAACQKEVEDMALDDMME